MNYHETAFTAAIEAIQREMGSYEQYAQRRERMDRPGLGPAERDFIAERDSFYLATIGQNGFPYIQHRGGPKGFLHVLDDRTLAFVDFSGNRQYISVGNLQERKETALFLMAYPHRARLKIYAKSRLVGLEEDPELFDRIDPAGYQHRPERLWVLEVEAFDWNCSQHITRRFTEEEVAGVLAPHLARIEALEGEVARLRGG